MLKHRNRLLIALTLTFVLGLLGAAMADARPIRAHTWENVSSPGTKPGATYTGAGEPDVGDHKNNPNNDPPPPTGNDTTLIGPNGYLWIMTIWARRCLGVGW
jgi:hypothetical protein